MKNLIIVILLFSSIIVNAQSLTVSLGDSQTRGMSSLNFQIEHISIFGGWQPNRTPFAHIRYNSYYSGITYYVNPTRSNIYLTGGYAINGIYYLEYGNMLPKNTVNCIIGVRTFLHEYIWRITKRFSFDIGAGAIFSTNRVDPNIECTLNFKLF
jgi:hypothetical protein